MTAINTNLLLSDAAILTNGRGPIIPWLGGSLQVLFTGLFAGASIELDICVKAPFDRSTLTDGDWIPLGVMTAPGGYTDELNPCLLSCKVSGAAGTTQVRAIVNG